MTRKDYMIVAEALADSRPRPKVKEGHTDVFTDCITLGQWVRTRAAIADSLTRDNHLFDRRRFYAVTET